MGNEIFVFSLFYFYNHVNNRIWRYITRNKFRKNIWYHHIFDRLWGIRLCCEYDRYHFPRNSRNAIRFYPKKKTSFKIYVNKKHIKTKLIQGSKIPRIRI